MRFELRTRNGDANIKSLSRDPAEGLRDRPAPPRQHLLEGPARRRTRAPGASRSGPSKRGRRCSTQPLTGPAYAVSGFGKLPRLAFILDGQVRLVPQAESSSVGGKLTTVVPVIPDAPIGYFKLDLLGGKQGYLVNTRSLCASPAKVVVAYTAQSGRETTSDGQDEDRLRRLQERLQEQAPLTFSLLLRSLTVWEHTRTANPSQRR